MPKLAANLSMLFTEHAFLDRFAAAADAGFSAVECQSPYAFSPDRIASALARRGLDLVLHNAPAGDWERGDRGLAAVPGREAEFRAGIERAIEYAKALGCNQVNCLTGRASGPVAWAVAANNLKFAAERLAQEGIRCLTEPINPFDMSGFFLDRAAKAEQLLNDVGSENFFIQYDIYHQQRTAGELVATFRRLRPLISHIQIADTPGRHEPGTGEINFPFIFAELDRAGYEGWVGCEYSPEGSTVEGLRWIEAKGARTSQ